MYDLADKCVFLVLDLTVGPYPKFHCFQKPAETAKISSVGANRPKYEPSGGETDHALSI